jgi:hypothetical protein
MLERPTLPQFPRNEFPHDGGRLRADPHFSQSHPDGLPFPAASTPVPNLLLDQIMPTLSDSEWRLLCVVCRQTLGFTSGDGSGQRRGRDWLTHRQLKARTGRASAAISKAVDGLVRKGLIEVQAMDGQPLLTPQERRRCQGMLFFCLAPRLLQTIREVQGSGNGGNKGRPGDKPVDNRHEK